MFSVYTSCLITSPILFDLPLPPPNSSITNISHLCIGVSMHLLCIFFNHLSLTFRILSFIEAAPTQSTMFLILSLLVCLYIYRNIFIFITFIFWMLEFLIDQYSTIQQSWSNYHSIEPALNFGHYHYLPPYYF